MSAELSELAAAARRGTARSSLPEPGLAPLGKALARITAPTPESTLLLRAGLAGLHALAGQALVKAKADIPLTLPPDAKAIPPSLSELLPQVAPHLKVLTELIGFVAAVGQTLGPQDLWELRLSHMPIKLWSVLGERGRWLARQNPDWRGLDPEQCSRDVKVRLLRSEVLEAHVADPETVAADLLTRWPDFKADERRAVLDAVAASLHSADLPLLTLASNDKLRDIQQVARQLSAHLPGEAQEAVRAALRASVSVSRSGKIKFLDVDLPAALGSLDPKDTSDSAARLMIGALPLPLMLETLNVTLTQLVIGLRDDPGYLESEFSKALCGELPFKLVLQLPESLDPGRVSMDYGRWPQSRIRRVAVEMVAAVSLGALDHWRVKLLASLLAALGEPLELPEAEQARLHELARVLLNRLGAPDADADKLSDAAFDLLDQLPVHLDPHRALPPMPVLPVQEPLPENAKKDEQQRYDRRHSYLSRLERLHTHLNQVLTLRRRVVEIMGRAP